VASVLVLASACSSRSSSLGPEELVRSESASIIGSTTSPGSQDAVVLLALRPGGTLHGLCTGTLVAPNLVLTARHCVSDSDAAALCSESGRAIEEGIVRADLAPGDLHVYTGTDGIEDIRDPDAAEARGQQIVHEDVATICNSDVAFLILDRSIQGRIAPLRLTRGARDGEPLTAIGWGLTEDGTLPTNRRQRADVSVLGTGPVTLDAQRDVGLGDSEFVVGEVFCSGDSGGPALSSKGAVVGVVSRGGGGSKDSANDASNCIGNDVINFYTDLARKPGLVAQAFGAAGQEPLSEGEPPGAAVGVSCRVDLDCSSDACVSGACARRCDDGATCTSPEICTPRESQRICALLPARDASPLQPGEPGAAPATATMANCSGCAASRVSSPGRPLERFAFGLGLAAIVMVKRRRCSRAPCTLGYLAQTIPYSLRRR